MRCYEREKAHTVEPEERVCCECEPRASHGARPSAGRKPLSISQTMELVGEFLSGHWNVFTITQLRMSSIPSRHTSADDLQINPEIER